MFERRMDAAVRHQAEQMQDSTRALDVREALLERRVLRERSLVDRMIDARHAL